MIELLIAITIIAVLSIAIALNFGRGALNARFDDQVQKIVHIIEQARSYSLNNYLVEDSEPTEYYVLTVDTNRMILEAHGATLTSTLEEVELADEFTISDAQTIYYVPPYGEIYIESEDSGITEFTFSVEDSSAAHSETISINVYGGYPEVEDL